MRYLLLLFMAMPLMAADVIQVSINSQVNNTNWIPGNTNLVGADGSFSNLITGVVKIPVSTCGMIFGGKLTSGTGTSNIFWQFQKSYDSITWETLLNTNLTSAATTAVYDSVAFTVADFPYIRCSGIWNTNLTPLTNIVLKVVYKQP